MKIFQWRKLSDAEFVTRVRKQLEMGKRWAWCGFIFYALVICVIIYLFTSASGLVSSFKSDFGRTPETSASFQIGLAIGLSIGAVVTMVFFYAISSFTNFLILLLGNRRDKLLIAYYDQLYPSDAKAPAPSSAEKFPH
jgi:hypothetical protein